MLTSNPLRKPGFFFLLQAIGLAVVLAALGWFTPVRVGDTPDYEQFPFTSVTDALAYPRTFGYPLFLQLAYALAPSHRAAPVLDFLIHVLAVFIFWCGLKRITRSDWTSMAVASVLLYSNTLLRYGNTLAADSLASSLAIAAVGWLLLTLFSSNRQHYHWWILALLVFVTYQVRPAYLFLIPLLPALGLSLHWFVTPAGDNRRGWRSLALKLCLVALLPYLAFCGIRWLSVDYSSLVSFGGNNFAAITCMYVTEEDVADFPADVRPVAEAVVKNRRALAERDPAYTAEATRSYMEIETPFDLNILQVCIPAAKETCGDDWPQVDRTLWRFAFAAVAAKPTYYAVWLVKAFIRGIYMMVSEIIMNPVYLILIAALVGSHAVSVILRKRSGNTTVDADSTFFFEFNALALIAFSFALANVLLVIITSPALGRFMDAAAVFLPCLLVHPLFDRLALCRRTLTR